MSRLPNPEEWITLQGGAPTLLESPSRQMVQIIHAYRGASGNWEGSGAVVPTPREQLMKSPMVRLSFDDQEVAVPAAFLWQYHGKPCEDRSQDGYSRLTGNEVDNYLQTKVAAGWRKLEL